MNSIVQFHNAFLYQYLNIADILIISFTKHIFYYWSFHKADVDQRNIILLDVFMTVSKTANTAVPFLKKCSSLHANNKNIAFPEWKLCHKILPV
jgi:hypothetical protein